MSIRPGYIRVSEILAQWDRFGGIDKDVLAKKAALGTAVHEAIGADSSNVFVPLEDSHKGYFESFQRWKRLVNPEIVETELRLYCDKLKITGCVDALVKFQGSDNPEHLFLVDYKTSVSEAEKIWPMQGAFYHYLATQNGRKLSPNIMFIKLNKDGLQPKVYTYFFSTQLMNVCISAYTTFMYLKKD